MDTKFKFLLLTLYLKLSLIQSQYSVLDTSGCIFPFTYNGVTYRSCTLLDKKYSWCSLEASFKGVWKYCHDQFITNRNCTTSCNNYIYPFCTTALNQRVYCLDRVTTWKNRFSTVKGDCPVEFSNISPFHTACLPPQKYVVKSGITEQEKIELITLHNRWRGQTIVPAKNMQKIYWDDDLAYVAQKHADRCSFAHDSMEYRRMPGTGRYAGQNIATVSNEFFTNFSSAFNSMFAGELKRWQYGVGNKPEFKGMQVGHYTQLVLAEVSRMGCGYSECLYRDRFERFFVCNYNYMQNTQHLLYPYVNGTPCDGCLKCENNLCDCGGKECYNEGVLNLRTCQCECVKHWTGDDCTIEIPTTKDENGCVFPFWLNNKLNYECIPSDYGDLFCSTTKVYGEDYDYNIGPYAMCTQAKKRSHWNLGKSEHGHESDNNELNLEPQENFLKEEQMEAAIKPVKFPKKMKKSNLISFGHFFTDKKIQKLLNLN